MSFELRFASIEDLAFARELTCRNMLRYYIKHELPWQDHAFDEAWSDRQNWLVLSENVAVGYLSLSRDMRAIYIRELQVAEAFHRQGAGSWAVDQVVSMAQRERRQAIRLTVFEDNPARNLYERKGLQVQGKDMCFLRMQLDISTHVL
ncbi:MULTISPECIES: GNAT family N-acetyltransferase [unclassified Pseudomonas]|uniref:GNAT family N-acetyltransferase n=1 Tax=unclassified Pseudomonas TaxID=196821 RepID=UPI000AAF0196|nr:MULTISPECIES: GNAT family N-acetyltransferase [unclassified Pseudomonas]MCR8931514.1 GNAT family N-acetyltransferase [Pseudomonas sp. S11A4]MCR8975119.1 GNAT family N-acetyltransferase [Pseudomonas sp. S11P7]